MTRARSTLVSLSDTPWYHVVCRCVRRAFLCGTDAYSGQSFEHRRGWIAERAQQLAGVFAVDVAAYAVMSNHYHLVLRIDTERVQAWSRDEVLRRWTQLFDGPLAVQQVLAAKGDAHDSATQRAIDEWVEKYRSRLCDLSWFMRVLNETIARQANAEDDVTGRFWEGRFKSQALLDEQAVLTAMAYVDLNPIRAQMADTPEASEHTSVAERIAALRPQQQAIPGPTARKGNPKSQVTPSNVAAPIIALKCEKHLAQLPGRSVSGLALTHDRTALPCLSECVWVLIRVYGFQQAHVAGTVRALLAAGNLVLKRSAVESGLTVLDAAMFEQVFLPWPFEMARGSTGLGASQAGQCGWVG